MYTSRLRNVGGSVMFAIPKPILDGLGLQANQEVNLSINDGRMIVEQQKKPRYSLEELLAQCDPNQPFSEEEQEWIGTPPVGNEVI